MPGIARIYEHVTPEVEQRVSDVPEARWDASLPTLDANERETLVGLLPHLGPVIADLEENRAV